MVRLAYFGVNVDYRFDSWNHEQYISHVLAVSVLDSLLHCYVGLPELIICHAALVRSANYRCSCA